MSSRSHNVIPPDGAIEVPQTDYEARIKALELKARQNDSLDVIDAPALDCTPDVPEDPCLLCSCAILSQRGAKQDGSRGILPTVKHLIPPNTFTLKAKFIKCEDWDSDKPSKHKKWVQSRLTDEEILDDDRESGHLIGEYKELLDEDTNYYIIQLRAIGENDNTFSKTPPDEPVPGDGTNPGQFLAKFHTKKLLLAKPKAPTCTDIVKNVPNILDEITGNADVHVKVTVDDPVLTIEDLDIDKVIVHLFKVPTSWPTKPIDPNEPSQPFTVELTPENLVDPVVVGGRTYHKGVIIALNLPLGKRYSMYKYTFLNAAGRESNDVTFTVPGVPDNLGCVFWSGGKVAGSDAEVPLPVITGISDESTDSRHSIATVSLNQGTQPILLKLCEIFVNYDYDVVTPQPITDPSWHTTGEIDLRQIDNIHTEGIHSFPMKFHHKKNKENKTYYAIARFTGVGRIDDTDGTLHAPKKFSVAFPFVPFYGKPLAHAGVAITADIASIINTDTEQADAFVSCVIRCFKSHPTDDSPMDGRDAGHSPAAPMAFKDAHVDEVLAVLTSDTSGTNEKYNIRKTISTEAERAATSITATRVVPGLSDLVYWKKTKFLNGDGHTVTTFPSAITVNLGGVKRATSDADVPVPTINSIVQDGNRHATVNVGFTQTSPQAIHVARLQINISTDSGVTWKDKEPFHLRNNEDFHIAGHTYSIPIYLSHPANRDVIYRVRLVTAGGFKSAWVQSNFTSPTDSVGSPAPTTTPSTPASIGVIENVADDVAIGMARIRVRVSTSSSGTFLANKITQSFALIKKQGDTKERLWLGGPVSDPTTSFDDYELFVPIGTKLTWAKNVFVNGDQEVVTSGSYDFIAGVNVVRALADSDVPVPSFNGFVQTDNRHATLTARFSQIAINAVMLREIILEKSLDAGSTWAYENGRRLKSTEFHTPGQTYDIPLSVKTPSNQSNLRFKLRVEAVGGFKSANVVMSATTAADPSLSLPAPSINPPNLSAGSVVINTVDGDPGKGVARIRIRTTLPSGTFASNNISEVWHKLRLSTDANETFWVSARPNTGDSQIDSEFEKAIGTSLVWVRTVFANGNQETSTTTGGPISFIAGIITVAPGDATVVPATTLLNVTNRNNKKDTVSVLVNQASSGPLIWLRYLIMLQNDGYGDEEVKRIPLHNESALYGGSGSNKTYVFNIKRSSGNAVTYKTYVEAVGGKVSSTLTNSTSGATTPDAPGDSAAATAPFSISVEERLGTFHVHCEPPGSNGYTTYNFEIVQSTSSVAPTLDPPVVGLEGVVKFRRNTGGSVRFKRGVSTSTPTLYFYARVRNAMFSTWSSYISSGAITGYKDTADYEIDPGIISLPTSGGTGHPSFDTNGGVGTAGGTPMYVTTLGTATFLIEFVPPSANGFSLENIEVQVYRRNSAGNLRMVIPFKPTTSMKLIVQLDGSYGPVFRCRYRNKNRTSISGNGNPDGWSLNPLTGTTWSYFVATPHFDATSGGFTAQGGFGDDFYSVGNRPNPYGGY